jgi:hypothetical protein
MYAMQVQEQEGTNNDQKIIQEHRYKNNLQNH